MKERDDTQKVASETNDSETWKKYKHLRNRITCRLKSEEKNWQHSKITECGRDSAKTWRTVRGILD